MKKPWGYNLYFISGAVMIDNPIKESIVGKPIHATSDVRNIKHLQDVLVLAKTRYIAQLRVIDKLERIYPQWKGYIWVFGARPGEKDYRKAIWIHKHAPRSWYQYIIPIQLNVASREPGDPKVYRWLFFGFEVYE